MTYKQMLRALYARSGSSVKLELGPTQELLRLLGRPDLRATNVVVAGTNGKGSTSALLAAALSRGGRRIGLFTSPHLVRFTERIRVDGRSIDPDEATDIYGEVMAAARRARLSPSFFECATAMAAVAFARADIDIGVWEVGLGGRLDATNAISHQLSIITRIALDHQDVLGHTLAEIAREKAGIIGHRQPVIMAPQRPAAARVVRAQVKRQGGCLIEAESAPTLPAALPSYQRDNVGTAARAATLLGVDELTFAEALASFHWPGRYQLVDTAVPILLDGAHNPEGMRAFCQALRDDSRLARRRLCVIFSALSHHGREELVAPLRDLGAPIFVCPCSSARSLSPASLQRLLPQARSCRSPQVALARARQVAARSGAVVVVVGSLYLVGDILSLLSARGAETLEG